MSDIRFDPGVVERALATDRWTLLTRSGLDLDSISTWDRGLARRSRILVPIDVQAFVVPLTGGEATVALAGDSRDPEPFASPTLRPPGVHLHWAMPDSLLAGADDRAGDVAFPALPDRWTVVRVVLPIGGSRALVTGWVIDAPTGRAERYERFTGTFTGTGQPLFEPLDAAIGGSLTWTSSYEASAGRFAFHDPLDDVDDLRVSAPRGFHGDHAVYVVGGWYTDLADDPLSSAVGASALEAAMTALGWTLSSDTSAVGEAPVDPDRARAASVLSDVTAPSASIVYSAGAREHLEVASSAVVPIKDVGSLVFGQDQPTYASFLHGAVLGVPLDGSIDADGRPKAEECTLAAGIDTDDVVAAFAAPSLGIAGASRLGLEQLAAAFTSNMLDRFGSSDGLDELSEQEHRDGFWSFPGAPLPLAHADRLRSEDSVGLGPTAVGRQGRSAQNTAALATSFEWHRSLGLVSGKRGPSSSRTAEVIVPPLAANGRVVTKPAPRLFRPRPPMIAIRGARPDHRHHGDGLFDSSGRLRCRVVEECQTDVDGVVAGASIVASIGSGAVPDETVVVVREAVVLDPYATAWLAAAGAPGQGAEIVGANRARLTAEMMLRYGPDATFDGSSHLSQVRAEPSGGRRRRIATSLQWSDVGGAATRQDHELVSVLSDWSLIGGTAPSPVAITTWRQPWVPVWLEWKVTVEGDAGLDGWRLDGLDLERVVDRAPTITRTFTGRSPTGQGVSTALHKGVATWLDAEAARDAAGRGVLPPSEQTTLESLGTLLGPIDLVSASLDGLVEQLLGIPYVGVLTRDEQTGLPVAADLPLPLFGGVVRVDALRLVDAFGRVLDLDPGTAVTTSTLDVEGATMMLRPRLQHGGRWLFRLVDPKHPLDADPALAEEAFVDQLAPQLAINPVAGFLLPDHIDEALEVFTVAGEPLGQVAHDPVSGAVMWEPAPGRAVPPDAGPFEGTGPTERIIADIATGLVASDVRARSELATAATPGAGTGRDTSLTALLRAIDTTLWTVDTYAALGTATVSALTGRPIAVVRATLRLDVPDDADELLVTAAGGTEARRAAFRALDEERFPVRLGELHRSDDSLLGFFVDDDHRRFHVVDKVVAQHAIVSGRHQGHLGLLGHPDDHATSPILHPYLLDEDTLWLRPGQTMRLTLLMLPAGKVHLTSGVLPRKELALAEDWVTPGLSKLAPSVRVGPVLVDPTEIRLPLVHTLGERQTFTRRTGPLTWRDDPIVAASQTAYLPTLPHEAQEGWVRVTPIAPPEASP